MKTYDELERLWSQLGPLPLVDGTVDLVVVRTGGGRHETPQRVRVSREAGVEGDRWVDSDDRDPESQVTLMMTRVARLIAGDDIPLHMPGDNLLVDLDLRDDNLPVGTRVRAGSSILEVTPEPHTGCKKFSERFGPGALRWVNLKDNRSRRLRGLHCKVVDDGEIAAGDSIVVLST